MCDIHEDDSFGTIKMVVPADINNHVIITLDQISARMVDDENKGEYQSLYTQIMVSKIHDGVKEKSCLFIDGDSG
jgi:hypothetical protein